MLFMSSVPFSFVERRHFTEEKTLREPQIWSSLMRNMLGMGQLWCWELICDHGWGQREQDRPLHCLDFCFQDMNQHSFPSLDFILSVLVHWDFFIKANNDFPLQLFFFAFCFLFYSSRPRLKLNWRSKTIAKFPDTRNCLPRHPCASASSALPYTETVSFSTWQRLNSFILLH